MRFSHKAAILWMMALLPTAANAHPAIFHNVSSFSAGVLHPLTGLDHLLAMLSIGLLASQKGGRGLWIWPCAFVTAMIAGGALGMEGLTLPLIEPAIAASLLVMGLLVATMTTLPMAAGIVVIATFGLFHGNAHGLEAPVSGASLLYALVFTFSTVSLHASGLGIGLAARRLQVQPLLRVGAALIAATGAFFLLA